jgi:hypothetical protein
VELSPVEILKAARERLTNPDVWGKGRRSYDRPLETCCVAEAIEECAPAGPDRKLAVAAVYNAAGLDWNDDKITEWNDAPERTHGDVLKTLDLAIAILKD